MAAKKKLNNLHRLALFLYLNGPSRAAAARYALFEQRFGRRPTHDNRGYFAQYFSRRGCFTSGCKYAIPGERQLWEPTGRVGRDNVYRGTWRLTPMGFKKAAEALQIIRDTCGCRVKQPS